MPEVNPKRNLFGSLRVLSSAEKLIWIFREFIVEGLSQSALRDLLKSSNLVQSTVAITIREHTWDVFVYNRIPALNFKSVKYEKPFINVSISQSERLEGDFTIQLSDKEKPIRPIIISRVKRLEDNSKFEVALLPGKYQIEILLGNETLTVSQVFIVEEDVVEVVRIPERKIFITKGDEFTAQKLYENLTSDQLAIQKIKENKQSNLISILNQLVRINSSETWVTRDKLDEGLKDCYLLGLFYNTR